MKSYTLLIILAAVTPYLTYGQENNYWFQNFGARSSLKGGIETGGVSTMSAVYYNPGALSFIEDEFLEGQADLVALDILQLDNTFGDGIDASSVQVNAQPSIFAYKHTNKKNPKWHYGLGVLSRHSSNFNLSVNYEDQGNYLLPDEDADVFQGDYSYRNRLRENWLVGVLAYRISDIIGLGLASNLVLRTQEYDEVYRAQAFPMTDTGMEVSRLALVEDIKTLEHRSLGFVFKPSVALHLQQLRLGLTTTFPNINLGLLNNFATKSEVTRMPDEPIVNTVLNANNQFYSGVYKTPFSVNLGGEYTWNKLCLALSAEWFAGIKPYEMIKANENSENLNFSNTQNSEIAIPLMAHKSVINIGMAVQYQIKESLTYIGSFRTDFNYFDTEALDRNDVFSPTLALWDVYHLTSGLLFSGPRTDLSLGLNYGFGKSDGNRQIVNMTNANQTNRLFGTTNNNASSTYHNISFTLGLSFNFNKSKGLRSNQI